LILSTGKKIPFAGKKLLGYLLEDPDEPKGKLIK
jgi:hypothetical protein